MKTQSFCGQMLQQKTYSRGSLSPADTAYTDQWQFPQVDPGPRIHSNVIFVMPERPTLKDGRPWQFWRQVHKRQVVVDRKPLVIEHLEAGTNKLFSLTHPVLGCSPLEFAYLSHEDMHVFYILFRRNSPLAKLLELRES
jgi:hypothetical protein